MGRRPARGGVARAPEAGDVAAFSHGRKGGSPMATADNLKEAFAGESQANRKYLAFG